MVRRFFVSLQRDNLINLRNGYYLVTIVVALVYFLLVRFLIPAETSIQPAVFVYDATPGSVFAAHVEAKGEEKVVTVGSVEELQRGMEENQNSIGVALEAREPLPAATLYFQSYQNQRARNLFAISVEKELRDLYNVAGAASVIVEESFLRSVEGPGQDIPFNHMWVPILLFSDAAMIGLIFIAALIFMEKDEGTLKAYLVSPGAVWEYLLSKALTMGALAVIFTLVFVLPVLGSQPNYLQLILVMFTGSIFASLLGAWIAMHFENLNQFLFPGIGAIFVLGIPAVAYFVPSFSPAWLRWIPSYPLVFGLREAVFPTGNPQIVWTAVLITLGLSALFLLLASRAFVRQLARG